MKYSIELQAEYKNNSDNTFYKKVEYTTNAKRIDSPIVDQEVSDWIEDQQKSFNLSNSYSVEINKINK